MKRLLVFLPLMVLMAKDGSVKWDFDPDADFARYKTFAFVPLPEQEKKGVLADPRLRDQVRNLIAGAMELKGIHEVPRDEPHDLAVRFWVAARTKEELISVPNTDPIMYWGGYPPYLTGAWSYWYNDVVTQHYHEAILLVDLIDRPKKDLTWRIYLTEKIKGDGSGWANAQKNIRKGLERYPPTAEQKEEQRKKASKLGVR